MLTNVVFSGLETGSIYALVALGMVLLYRVTNHLNFGQSEVSLLAGYLGFSLASLALPVPVAFVTSVGISGLVSVGFFWVFVQHGQQNSQHSREHHLSVLLASLGLGFFISGNISQWWGGDTKIPLNLVPTASPVAIVGLRVPISSLVTAGVGLGVMVLLYWLLQHSRWGLMIRGVADNPQSARSLGIPVARIHALSWGVSAVLGAVAALLFAPTSGLHPSFMLDPINKGFAAAVLGGISSFPGAVLGGYLLGIAEVAVGTYVSLELKLSLAFLVIVAVLLLRPQGLLGQR
jgi:branched-subunit amino acid ABC-type transport system permease component